MTTRTRKEILKDLEEVDVSIQDLNRRIKKDGFDPKNMNSEEALEKDIEYAQSLIDKTFREFKQGAKWTNRMKKMAETAYYVFAPTGRRRNLWAAMTEDKQIVSRQVRRGSNAPIQGFGSEIGTKASRLIMESYYRTVPSILKLLGIKASTWDYKLDFNRIVHDASYFAVPYDMVIPFIHIAQYEASYGISDAMKKEFGIQFTIEPEIEMEFGAHDAGTIAWDWSLPNLINCLDNAIKDAHELGQLEGSPEEVMSKVLRPYRNKKIRKLLQDKYPLLGVSDLDKQIDNATNDYLTNLRETAKNLKGHDGYDSAKSNYQRFKKLMDAVDAYDRQT